MSNINIIDIEASGLHFDSYPIEIAVSVNGELKSWLIKPEDHWRYWCDIAESMHGISREQLQQEGMSAMQVAAELNEFLQGAGEIYSDAAYWDNDWIDTLYLAVNQERAFHIYSLFDLMNDAQMMLFKVRKSEIAKQGKYQLHRAADDVQIICRAYATVTN